MGEMTRESLITGINTVYENAYAAAANMAATYNKKATVQKNMEHVEKAVIQTVIGKCGSDEERGTKNTSVDCTEYIKDREEILSGSVAGLALIVHGMRTEKSKENVPLELCGKFEERLMPFIENEKELSRQMENDLEQAANDLSQIRWIMEHRNKAGSSMLKQVKEIQRNMELRHTNSQPLKNVVMEQMQAMEEKVQHIWERCEMQKEKVLEQISGINRQEEALRSICEKLEEMLAE